MVELKNKVKRLETMLDVKEKECQALAEENTKLREENRKLRLPCLNEDV